MQKKMRDWIERLAAERPVGLAFMVLVVTTCVVVPLSIPFWKTAPMEFAVNVMSEAYGTLFDLLILGWLLLWLNNLADRRQQKMRYREEIEDALGWRSPVASHRIVSNVRRLNRSNVTSGIQLPEAFLRGASLEGVTLRDSQLWGAHLEEASLREADLSGSILAGASFEEADLESARLRGADLRGATMQAADMERADFEEADLRGANLADADLQYARLADACLERASLSGTNLRGAVLDGADLGRATVHEANLTGATLEGARLDGADFTGAQLREADLRGASLDGALFRAADLTEIRLDEGEEATAAFEHVATLYEAALDDELRARLEDAFPHLFELPGEEGAPPPPTGPASEGKAASEAPAPSRNGHAPEEETEGEAPDHTGKNGVHKPEAVEETEN